MEHDELVHNVEKFFVADSAIWEKEKIPGSGATEVDKSIAQYTGGLRKVKLVN